MADERSRQMMTCMFRDREAAERGYGCLTSRGYGKDDVSLLMSEEGRNRHFPKKATTTELGSKAAEGAGVGVVAGGGLGALLLGLAAAGFAIPGLPILAMGPLAAALTGAGSGGAVGALVGGPRGLRHSRGAGQDLRDRYQGRRHRDGRDPALGRGRGLLRARVAERAW